MINLLPPEEKQELGRERNKKLAIILGDIALISLISLALILFSLKFHVSREATAQKFNLQVAENRHNAPNVISFKKVVSGYNAKLLKVNQFFTSEIYLGDVLKTVVEIERPPGLYFNELRVDRSKDGMSMSVVIAGFSNTRENLLQYKDNLEKQGKLTNIIFPPDNWIKPVNLKFSVSFDMK